MDMNGHGDVDGGSGGGGEADEGGWGDTNDGGWGDADGAGEQAQEMTEHEKNLAKMKQQYDAQTDLVNSQITGGNYQDERNKKARTLPLRRFHNEVKRKLINRFAKHAPRVLDLASGESV
jgi:hypothetical protein